MPVHVPGPGLLSSVPFKHLGGKGKASKKDPNASLNLTAFVDMMTILVTFLLMTFSASGEIILAQKGVTLPDAANKDELLRAPIITIASDSINFNGEPMADPRTILNDTSMEWKILELYERLKVEKTQFELMPMDDEQKKALSGLLVLQADKDVDAKILNRVMKTAFASGYPNIMFAVNQRGGGGGGGGH